MSRTIAAVTLLYVAVTVTLLVLGVARIHARNAPWVEWSAKHCTIVSISAGGFGSSEERLYACDDGGQYVTYGRTDDEVNRPDGWREEDHR